VANRFMSAMEPIDPTTQAAVPVRAAPVPAPVPAVPPPARVMLNGMLRVAAVRSVPMLSYQLNRLGRGGVAGAGLILFSAIFLFAAVLPQHQQILSLRGEIREAQLAGTTDQSPRVRLGRFMEKLPKRSELPAIAGQIFKLAAASGVVLDQGRYELAPLHSGHVARYRMSFPIKGPYPNIRRFIDSTLSTIPAASVDGMRIERKTAGDANVDADLRFSIFVRNET
jgi:hypothetical protein